MGQDDIVHGPRINPAVAVGCSSTHVLAGVRRCVPSLAGSRVVWRQSVLNGWCASVSCEPLHRDLSAYKHTVTTAESEFLGSQFALE